jgi:histone H3/H4
MSDSQFSVRAMKNLIAETTDKRIAEPLCEEMASVVETYVADRSDEAIAVAESRNRKTVKESDVRDTGKSLKSFQFNGLANAPVERILRKEGAERVSEDAVEVLKDEAVSYAMDLSQDVVDLCDHAGRNTVKLEDLHLALR